MSSRSVQQAAHELYSRAAITPDRSLCCVGSTPWRMPGLTVPDIMHEMNYGCGTTVQPHDIPSMGRVLYIGAGGGLELLQFAYLTRRRQAVIGVDAVDTMLDRCRENLAAAAAMNDWLQDDFIELREGDALKLPVDDDHVDVVAQNCLFNIFEDGDLQQALHEAHRVLRPGGRLVLSDPISETPLPPAVRDDPDLRAACLGGAIPLDKYVERLVETGFGTIEIRARRPYRVLTPDRFHVEAPVLLESIELAAFKTPVLDDGPCVFTGQTAIYVGLDEEFDDKKGHVLPRDVPVGVCDKTAGQLDALGREDIVLTPSTWHYGGGGCC